MVRESAGQRPRGKTSPYGCFVKMCYEEHKKKYPNENVQVSEISKKCSEKWKTMIPAEKQRFVELAQKDAERYQAEVAAFGGEGAMRKRKRGVKKDKDVNAPRRPLSAFFLFSQVNRSDVQRGHPEWRVGQVAQELGRQWRDMTDVEKKKYEEMATRDKARYEVEMREYKAGGSTGSAAKKPLSGGGGAASTSAASQHPSADDEPEDDDDDDGDEDE